MAQKLLSLPKLRRQFIYKWMCGLFACLMIYGCTKEIIKNETNPFAGITIPNPNINVIAPDSNTITGIHQYTFMRTCALSGCHDGTFEPDFRTVQSAYSTLVYQPIIKNNPEASFEYRVKPNSPSESWLIEKVTTNDPIISRMPVNLPALSEGEIRAMKSWIQNGAKDFMGNTTSAPNYYPSFLGLIAYAKLPPYAARLDDTLRIDRLITNPFVMPRNIKGAKFTDAEIWLLVKDGGENPTAVADLQINQLGIYTQIDGGQPFKKLQAEYMPAGQVIDKFTLSGKKETFYWRVKINPQEYQAGSIYYLRYETKDPQMANSLTVPNTSSPAQLKTYAAFYVLDQ